jgi:lysyl-tRNA synthetase class 2
VPSVLATIFVTLATACALLTLVPLLRSRTEPVQVAAEYMSIPLRPNLALAAFLALIAASLRRRTRVAWWFVLLFYLGPAFLGALGAAFVNPWFAISAVVLGAMLAVTIVARKQFTARVARGNGWRALAALVVGLTVASLLGFLLILAFPGTLTITADKIGWAVNPPRGLGAETLTISGRPPAIVSFLCGLFGALAFLAAAWVLFRPQRRHAYLKADQEIQIRTLLATTGERDSLGYFATRRDKTAIFSPTGKAAIAYRVVAGTSLASGDPIGDPESWPPAIDVWLAETREYAWTAAVIGASEVGAEAYARAGLDALQLGDEAVINVGDFDLDGRSMRAVRQAVHRIEKAGYRCRVRRHAEIPRQELTDVAAHTETWRNTADERGFSMALGRLGDPADGACVLVEAVDAGGELRAVLSLVPWGRRGLSLDLMRRDRDSDNGLMEFMVVNLIEQCRRLDVERISLNFAMFREVFEEGGRIGAGPIVRLTRSVLLFFSRWWQLESLYRSNAKYQPEWVPRFTCFASSRDLPRISIAMGIAEGFVPAPSFPSLLRRGRGRPEQLEADAGVSRIPVETIAAGAAQVPAQGGYANRPEQRASAVRSLTGCESGASTRTQSDSPVRPPPPRCAPRTQTCRRTPAPGSPSRSRVGWCSFVPPADSALRLSKMEQAGSR